MSVKRFRVYGPAEYRTDGDCIDYADHIAEVSRIITTENARLESCRKLRENAQEDRHRLEVEVQRLRDLLHEADKELNDYQCSGAPFGRSEFLQNRIAAECGNDRPVVGRTDNPEQDHV